MNTNYFVVPLLLACGAASAQDVSLLAGTLNNTMVHERSFAAQLGLSQRFSPYTSVGAEYFNEGHPSKHHRDGLTAQFWLHTPIPERGASFAVGLGPYYFFDTTTGLGHASDYRNVHGWGSMASVSMKWHLAQRTYIEVRANHVAAHGKGNSNSVLIGMGYELRNVPDHVRDLNQEPGDRMLMLQFGQAIVNSFESERARALGVEYRGTVTQNMEWSTAYLSEGRVGVVERRGVTGQLWLLRPFTDRTVVELGVGGYLMRDRIDRSDASEASFTRLVPIVTIGARYRLSPDWRAQLSWSRVVTSYHRDSDVLLLGVGKMF
ncbi:hypothetical protein CR105_23875 [Massilia eurypsychrophila]|jgi:hypothetical protein|uniref:Autotransporter domain-containing protein n=1 Tax=Massilia eurypsychrophila TaxID=1485217 RepID=A0A2G8T8Z8_9BURK|nr:hypothetical protein [Massilia eurypsychrophila]PIL42530.1 hypothetical protein CR105_23875 [Massilia eurypsychrophila]